MPRAYSFLQSWLILLLLTPHVSKFCSITAHINGTIIQKVKFSLHKQRIPSSPSSSWVMQLRDPFTCKSSLISIPHVNLETPSSRIAKPTSYRPIKLCPQEVGSYHICRAASLSHFLNYYFYLLIYLLLFCGFQISPSWSGSTRSCWSRVTQQRPPSYWRQSNKTQTSQP